MDQLAFSHNEAEAYAYGTKSATLGQIAVKAYECKRQSGSVTDIVPGGISAEVVERRLSDEERTCASGMEESGISGDLGAYGLSVCYTDLGGRVAVDGERFWYLRKKFYGGTC